MAKKPAKSNVTDYHVIPHVGFDAEGNPREECGRHIINAGPDCPCEPYCAVQTNLFRLFVHCSDCIDVHRSDPEPPRGPVGPDRQIPMGGL